MIAFLLTLDDAGEEKAVTALWEHGTSGLEERARSAGRLSLLAYFEDGAATVEGLERALGDAVQVQTAPIPDVDWVARFREGFRAFAVGGFWIVPEWDRDAAASAGRRRLVVDPGRAFGTGTHESTALCLARLEQVAEHATLGDVLDVGTGSGILGVAAAQLGAARVVAADLDPESIDSARQHAALNAVTLRLVQADGGRPFRTAAFDTVVANITAPLLIARAAELAALPRRSGRLILAGLLAQEAAAVRDAYRVFPRADETRHGEWASLRLEHA
jgi:ribosomal protein L11 methyltransferase